MSLMFAELSHLFSSDMDLFIDTRGSLLQSSRGSCLWVAF